MSATDPKAYWKMINNVSDNNKLDKDTPNITEFGEHFKLLNNGPEISENEESILKEYANIKPNNILDSPITGEEILFCIKKLKNN